MKSIKEKKKGFTLIELLVTIAILSLVMVIVSVGIMKLLDKSKDDANSITDKGIKEAARTYAYDEKNDNWNKSDKIDENYEYLCVTIAQLINSGILKDNKIDKNKYPLDMYVAVFRNTDTKTIEKEEFADDTNLEIKKVCASLELVKPVITLNNEINIRYDNKNIKGEAYHYFKSTVSGSNDNDIYECNDNLECSLDATRDIKANTWYRALLDEVNISGVSDNGKIIARIMDRWDNFAESEKEFSVNKIIFVKGMADKIDGDINDIERSCIAEKGSSCKIVSPTIEKVGYEPLGWNNDNSATESNWDIGVDKDVDEGITYYPVLIQNPIFVYYHTNGGTITGSSGGFTWTTDDNGLIYRDGSAIFYSVLSNASPRSDGLANYNNSSYINITKPEFIGKNGSEWNTKPDGSGTSFSQSTVYTYDTLINYAVLDGENYRLDLYVNWVIADDEDPTCTIDVTEGENDGELLLTVKGQDTMKLADLPYSWTEDDSGYDSYEPKTVSSVGTYTAYVRDAAGNKNHCSVKITKTSVSKYKKTTKTCKIKYGCKASISDAGYCSTGSKCSSNSVTSGKCECYTSTAASTYCPSSYPYESSATKKCYKLGSWSSGSYVWANRQSGKLTQNQCDNLVTNNSCSSTSTSNYCYSSCTVKNTNTDLTEDALEYYCYCLKKTRTVTYSDYSYSCSSGNNLGNGYCYTYYSYGGCSGSGAYRGSSSNNGNTSYCYQDKMTSCSDPYWVNYVDTEESKFTTSTSENVTSCSVGTSFNCNTSSVNGKSYVSKCEPTAYSCSSGTKINNKYCYLEK